MDGSVVVSDSDGVGVGVSGSLGDSLGVSDSLGDVVGVFVGFFVGDGLPCVGRSLGLPLEVSPVPGLVLGSVAPGDGVALVDGVAVPDGPGDEEPPPAVPLSLIH
ncbi:hypothetical protein, partial [Streptomyces sp. NRRL S-15]|uniref:hypothetical protein n=2 Tax=Streptomyces TaxID=1883 RepID=UPI0018FFA7A1